MKLLVDRGVHEAVRFMQRCYWSDFMKFTQMLKELKDITGYDCVIVKSCHYWSSIGKPLPHDQVAGHEKHATWSCCTSFSLIV